MRLQKLLANAGVGSRRSIEDLIRAGKIQVNGKPAQIGMLASLQDKVQINGKLIVLDSAVELTPRVLLYHKPEGEICSRVSEEGKPSVFDNLPPIEHARWVMVGRLDINTSGLLIFTNHGELAHCLMHPRFNMDRQYAVRVIGNVTENTLAQLKTGVHLPEGLCKVKNVVARNVGTGANQWFTLTLTEGRYREVRRLWESQGCTVSRLIRIKYGSLSLPRELKKGRWCELPTGRVKELSSSLGL